jgi:hypothetical protein
MNLYSGLWNFMFIYDSAEILSIIKMKQSFHSNPYKSVNPRFYTLIEWHSRIGVSFCSVEYKLQSKHGFYMENVLKQVANNNKFWAKFLS